MRQLEIDLGERSYPILLGERLLARSGLLRSHVRAGQVMIVTNDVVAPLYLDRAKQAFEGLQCDAVILPDGEAHKTLTTVNRIFDALLEADHHRDTTLVALGGGVVCDMTGFAAACYQRGVGFIQMPTTLLAQVDASIGGKAGVNHPLGKNMIGAFHQPHAVIIDTATLKTLPERERRAGLAEIIKVALIRDPAFFGWLEENAEAVLRLEPEPLTEAIERACAIKAEIVAQDEREHGIRAWLNLGHTFGHAIEQVLGYGAWLHGEAIALGLLIAAKLSVQHCGFPQADCDRIRVLLERVGLPTQLPAGTDHDRLREAMTHDKKVADNQIRFVLLKALGQPIITSDLDLASVF